MSVDSSMDACRFRCKTGYISIMDRMTRQHIYADIGATQDREECILAHPNHGVTMELTGTIYSWRRKTKPSCGSCLTKFIFDLGAKWCRRCRRCRYVFRKCCFSVISSDQSAFSLELQDSRRVKLSSPSFRCCLSKNALNIFEHMQVNQVRLSSCSHDLGSAN